MLGTLRRRLNVGALVVCFGRENRWLLTLLLAFEPVQIVAEKKKRGFELAEHCCWDDNKIIDFWAAFAYVKTKDKHAPPHLDHLPRMEMA